MLFPSSSLNIQTFRSSRIFRGCAAAVHASAGNLRASWKWLRFVTECSNSKHHIHGMVGTWSLSCFSSLTTCSLTQKLCRFKPVVSSQLIEITYRFAILFYAFFNGFYCDIAMDAFLSSVNPLLLKNPLEAPSKLLPPYFYSANWQCT